MNCLRVVITGASSGIGLALARHYAGFGAILGLIARRKDRLRRLADGLSCPCEIYAADVRDARAMREAAAQFVERHGPPDIVIANAGVSRGNLTDHPEDLEVFETILDTNVIGMARTFHPYLASMRQACRGTLVGIASVAGYRGLPGASAYSASKAAAISYLESLRVELRGSGISVITICPGYVDTPMTAKNPYPMPFIMSAETAAGKIARVIARNRPFAVIPWQMAVMARILKILPNVVYDRLLAKAPHKPRSG